MNQKTARRLCDLRSGQIARVIGFDDTESDYVHRLMLLGLTPGTSLRFLRHAPFGDPVEILVRGTRLCLRRREADCMQLSLDQATA